MWCGGGVVWCGSGGEGVVWWQCDDVVVVVWSEKSDYETTVSCYEHYCGLTTP